jgi:hypothetical protein
MNLVLQGGESGIGIRWDWNPGGFKCEIWVCRILLINPYTPYTESEFGVTESGIRVWYSMGTESG